MTRRLIIAILIFSAACSHGPRRPPTEAPESSTGSLAVDSPAAMTSQQAPSDLIASESLVLAEDIRPYLYDWVRKNGNTSYARLAKEAQRLVGKYGLLYWVDISGLEKRDDRFRQLNVAKGESLVFNMAGGIVGPCGAHFVYVSVLGFDSTGIIVMTNRGPKVIPKTLAQPHFQGTEIRVSPEAAPLTLMRPSQDVPWNVSPDGRQLLWQYDLKMSLLENWWKKVVRRFRDLRDERPFLLVKISEAGFTVESNERALSPGQYEQVQSGIDGVLRRAYKPRSVLVDINSACH